MWIPELMGSERIVGVLAGLQAARRMPCRMSPSSAGDPPP
jgi:hypothetical protein